MKRWTLWVAFAAALAVLTGLFVLLSRKDGREDGLFRDAATNLPREGGTTGESGPTDAASAGESADPTVPEGGGAEQGRADEEPGGRPEEGGAAQQVPPAIRGRVLDRATGRGVPGALVLVCDEQGARVEIAMTKAEGAYFAALPAPGRHEVSVEHEDYCERRASILAGADCVADLDLLLDEKPSVAGRVTDGAGRPVASAVVELDVQSAFRPQAKTDEAGRYELRRLEPGRHSVCVRQTRFASKLAGFDAEPGARKSLDLELGPGEALPGRVVFPDRKPVRRALVNAVGLSEDPPDSPLEWDLKWAWSDAEGKFLLEGLRPGVEYRIWACFEKGLGCTSEDERASSGSGWVEIVLPRLGWLEGRVVDAGTGGPVSGVRLHLLFLENDRPDARCKWTSPNERASADGSCRIGPVPAGTFRIVAHAEGYVSGETRVSAGADGAYPAFRIALRKGAVLKGVVLSAGTFAPVAGASIFCSGHQETHTDEAGKYEIGTFDPGRFRTVDLRVRHEDFPATTFTLPVPPWEDVRIILPRGGRIAGVVRKADGTPAGGIHVAVLEEMAPYEKKTRTDDAGRYVLRGVPPGKRVVGLFKTRMGEMVGDAAGRTELFVFGEDREQVCDFVIE